MSSSSSRSNSGANSQPVGDGSWGLRLGLGIIAFALTVFILVVVTFGIWRKHIESNGRPGPPSFDVSPRTLSFGTVEVGAETSPQVVTLVSTGREPVELGGVAISGSDHRDFPSAHECSERIPRTGRKCTVSVTFSPRGGGSRSARLTIRSVAGDTEIVSLSGTGTGGTARARLIPRVKNVSVSEGGTKTLRFTLKNIGSASLEIYGVALKDQYDFFSSTNDACTNISLEPEASCSIEVNFTPTSVNNSEGKLVIEHDAPGSPSRARLEGATIEGATTLPPTGKTTLSPSSTASPSSSSMASPVP